MPKFRVAVPEVWHQVYEVDAQNEEEAKKLINEDLNNGEPAKESTFIEILKLEKYPGKWDAEEIK